ncbi:MAG: hypothetical protein KJT03_04535, partial [Verrucomicrobiae bacterium]|nr:hypothetical protein [Verrucomicrobiae bacterium]
VEWYFGYTYPNSDLTCQDWRSREKAWEFSRYALEFFQENVPFQDMLPDNLLTSLDSDYVMAREGEVYVVYFPEWGHNQIDLREHRGPFTVQWFNPRTGEGPLTGEALKERYPQRRIESLSTIEGRNWADLGPAPYDHHEDWVVLLKKSK